MKTEAARETRGSPSLLMREAEKEKGRRKGVHSRVDPARPPLALGR